MEKLKLMNLNLSELQESRAATVVSNLRKHSDVDIANAAKQLRTFWKESMIESVAQSHPISSNANATVNTSTESYANVVMAEAATSIQE